MWSVLELGVAVFSGWRSQASLAPREREGYISASASHNVRESTRTGSTVAQAYNPAWRSGEAKWALAVKRGKSVV